MISAINVTTPDGRCGPWAIESFEIEEQDAAEYNLRLSLKGMGSHHYVTPGKYKRLVHAERGVVMSNTPMEVRTNAEFIKAARGNVLINGLGLGMVLHAILNKPEVKKVTVVELDLDVIALTAPHFREHIASERLVIVNEDCFKYVPPRGSRYHVVWHDIWDTICDENVYDMDKLKRKYAHRALVQMCWAEADCKAMRQVMIDLCKKAGRRYEDVIADMKAKGLL